ncbi:MAG: hypothetical protein AB8H79_16775 [Myxococcota bacterium]
MQRVALALLTLPLLLAACTGDDDTGTAVDPITTGSITADDFERSGLVETYGAFGFATNGVGVVFLSPNVDSTCDSVTEYLNKGGDYNPIDVLTPGSCSITVRFGYDDQQGMDGVVHTQADVGTLVNVNCAMGDGAFELVGSGRDRGYQYVGDDGWWWQGNAKTFSFTTTAGTDDNTPDLVLDLGEDFSGQFIYEDLTPDPATGTVSGTVKVTRCQGLTQTPPWN